MRQKNRERLGTMELINEQESDLSEEQENDVGCHLVLPRCLICCRIISMISTVPVRPMPALQQVNNSLRHWWQAQSPSDQCPHYNKSTTVSDTDDKHSPRPANACTTTSQQQSQTLMTNTVPVWPMPALQQVNHSLRHWWQAQSPSDQCPHYNKSTTVSDTDDKHSPRPTNARTTTSQQQSQTLMTSTVPVWPMPALQQVNNSLRHWWQAQSPSDQCPHYNKSTTVSDTDDKHSPRPTNARTTTSQPQSQTLMTSTVPVRPMPALQQVNHSLRHWWQAQSPSDQCPHYNKSTTVSDTDDKHSPRPTNARTTTSQPQSQTLMTSTVPVRPMPALQQVNHSLKHWWQAQSPSDQCPHYNKSTTVSDTDDKHSPRPANARTTTSQPQSQTLMTSTVPVRPMPALQQVNHSLRHWWQAQSPSGQCPHYNKSTTVSNTDDKHSPRPTNARTTTSQQQSQTLMISTVPVRPMPALQQVNHSLRHWWQAQSPSGQCPHYNKSTTVSNTDDKHSPRPTNARTKTSQQQSQTLMTSTVPVRPMPALQQVNNSLRHWWQAQSPSDQCPHYNKSTTVSDSDDKHSPRPTNACTTTSQPQSQSLMTSTVPVRPMPQCLHYNKSTTVSDTDDKHSPRPTNARTTTSQQQSQTLMTSTVPVRPMPALQQVNNSLRHWWQAQSPSDQCPHYNKSTTVSDTDDKHSPRPTNARTTTSQQQSQTLMTSTVPVRPMPALQQVNHSLRHWWQAQSPSDQCPHYNKSTTVSDTDDKHSPRPTNARTTTSQQQSQTLMTSTVPVRPMPALKHIKNSLRTVFVAWFTDTYW